MKKMLISRLKVATGIVMMIVGLGKVQAQNSAYARATATIVSPVGISKTEDMIFGSFQTNQKGGAITLSAGNTRTTKGGLIKISPDSVSKVATFEIEHGNTMYDISTPNTCISLSRTSGLETIEVDKFTVHETSTGESPLSPKRLTIGATIYVNGMQPAGSYSTNEPFTVIINYN